MVNAFGRRRQFGIGEVMEEKDSDDHIEDSALERGVAEAAFEKLGIGNPGALRVGSSLADGGGRQVDSGNRAQVGRQQQLGIADPAAQAQDARFVSSPRGRQDAANQVRAKGSHGGFGEVLLREP